MFKVYTGKITEFVYTQCDVLLICSGVSCSCLAWFSPVTVERHRSAAPVHTVAELRYKFVC